MLPNVECLTFAGMSVIVVVCQRPRVIRTSLKPRTDVASAAASLQVASKYKRTAVLLEALFTHARSPCLFLKNVVFSGPPLWSSGQSSWLQTQSYQVRFPALPDFLSSSGSGTGSTQPL
jgi:hypothetical protein